MANFVITEGKNSAFNYRFTGFNPSISVDFVEATATAADGFGGTLIAQSTSSLNGFVNAV